MIGPRRMLAEIIRISGMHRLYPKNPMILVYHGFHDKKLNPSSSYYSLDVREFVSHLRYICRHRVVVSWQEFTDTLENNKEPDRRWLVLTFDDALIGVEQYAIPELIQRGLPYLINVPSGIPDTGRSIWEYETRVLVEELSERGNLNKFIQEFRYSKDLFPEKENTNGLFFRDERDIDTVTCAINDWLRTQTNGKRRIYLLNYVIDKWLPELSEILLERGQYSVMGWAALKAIRSDGGSLAAHGHFHHPHNELMDEVTRREELIHSGIVLRDKADQVVNTFVWPEGVFTESSLKMAHSLGYRYLLTTAPGPVLSSDISAALPRTPAEWPLPQLLWNMGMTA